MVSRRGFIKGLAAAGASGSLVGCSSARLARLDNGAVFADGGESVLFHSYSTGEGEIALIRLSDGVRSIVSRGANRHDRWPSISADGKTLAFISDEGSWQIYTVRRDVTSLKRLTTSDNDHLGAAISPSGERVATGQRRADGVYLTIVERNGQEQTLTAGGIWPSWTSDNRIYFNKLLEEGICPAFFDLSENEETVLLNPQSRFSGTGVTPDGLQVYGVGRNDYGQSIQRLDLETGKLEDLGFSARIDSAPQVSPDGKLLVFGYGDSSANGDIFVCDLDSLTLTNFTDSRPYLSFL